MGAINESDLLWYIQQRNVKAGYPTVITMSEILHAFPSATRKDVLSTLRNLANFLHYIRCPVLFVYELTMAGLEEIERLNRPAAIGCDTWQSLLGRIATWLRLRYRKVNS